GVEGALGALERVEGAPDAMTEASSVVSPARRRAGLSSTGSPGESSGVPVRRRRSPVARAAPAANDPRAPDERSAVARRARPLVAADFLVAAVPVEAFLVAAFLDVTFFAVAVLGAA
ncbi:MAG: hypothetical protein L0H96_25145, partial [Humibacillus sp.]|nr:hypothetical protein [Humibacillus sp.]